MAEPMLLLTEQKDGTYRLNEPIRFELDEDWETEDTLVNVTKERGKLVLAGREHMITVHVENIGGLRYPHMSMAEKRAL